MNATAIQGELTFDESGHRIDVHTKAVEFCESALVKQGMIRYLGPRLRISLGRHVILGQLFDVIVNFDGNPIQSVELSAITGKEGTSWADWTLENEMATKKLHEDWAAKVLGQELVVKPFFTPNGVAPFEVKWDSARYAPLPWGQVVSWYDSRGRGAYMSLLYGIKDPA